jgi:hypothetical protein
MSDIGLALATALNFFELALNSGEYVVFASHPDVQGRQQEDAHNQIRNETPDDHDRERPL